MHFDDAIEECGGFGPYQKRMILLLCLGEILVASHAFAPIFLAYTPKYHCSPPDLPAHINCTMDQVKEFYIPQTDTGFSMCETFERPSDNLTDIDMCPNGQVDINATLGLKKKTCTEFTFDKSQMKETVVSEFNLVCSRAGLGSSIGGIFMGANIIGYFFFGVLADRIGRKTVMLLGNFTSVISGLINAFMPNIAGFLVMRAILALAVSAKGSGSIILGLEYVPPKNRVLVGSVLGAMWSSAYFLITFLAYFTREWRIYQIVQTVPEIILIPFLLFFIDESARWQITRGKDEKAHEILRQVAKRNGRVLPDDIKITIESRQNEKLTQMFKSKPLLILSIGLWIGWFTDGLVYYGLAFTSPALGNNPFMTVFLMGLVELPANVAIYFVLTRIGRVPPLLVAYAGSGICLLLTMAVPKGDEMIGVTIFLVLLGKFLIMSSYCIIWIYSNEVYPTSIRSSAVSISYAVTRVSSLGGAYIGLLYNISPYLSPVICGILGIVCAFVMLFMPETKGIKMAMTIEEGDYFVRNNWGTMLRRMCGKQMKEKHLIDDDSEIDNYKKTAISNDSLWFTLSQGKLYQALKESKETTL